MRPLGGAFGVILGSLSGASRGLLGSVLTASWDVWECLGTLRSVRPSLVVFESRRSSGCKRAWLGPTAAGRILGSCGIVTSLHSPFVDSDTLDAAY